MKHPESTRHVPVIEKRPLLSQFEDALRMKKTSAPVMDAHELARWTRFAAKGGIGKCTAVVDCIAQEMGEDLMFLKGDEITVLMQLPDAGVYLGHCEGVVGRFSGKDVQFHGKLKKPVIAKRGSANMSHGRHESRMSISLVDGRKAELTGQRLRQASESPTHSRPASRLKQTPSPSHATMLSYFTSRSHSSEDQSLTTLFDPLDTTMIGGSRTPTKTGHAKNAEMGFSVSGASVFSVGSASIYSEASTATSVYSAANAAFHRSESRNGSIHSVKSADTERDVPGDPEYGNAYQTNSAHKPGSASLPTPNAMLSTSTSATTSITASTSASGTSFASISTHGPDDSFGSIGSISELEAKQFDTSKLRSETQSGFILVPPPLELGGSKNGTTPPAVAPLRLSKSPRLTPSPGFPPSSPLPVPPVASGEHPRSTPVSPALPSPLSLASAPLSPRLPTSTAHVFPGSLSPGLPSSLAPGQRSPGLPGSLSPGFRPPAFPYSAHAQSQYAFSSGSGSNTPNSHSPLPSPYGSGSSSLTSPYMGPKSSPNESSVLTAPHTRTPPVPSSPFGVGQAHRAPLSPPPSSPLPPLPGALSSPPSFSVAALPIPGARSAMGTAATAAASGRSSPLVALSSSLPSSHSALYADGRGERHVEDRRRDEEDVSDGEMEGEDATRLSTLDAFRRHLDDSPEEEDEMVYRGRSVDDEREVMGDEDGKRGEDEDAHSDGEMGIGLSLMGALGSEDDDEDPTDGAEQALEIRGGNDNEPVGVGSAVGLGIDEKASDISGGNGNTTAMAWTRYEPSSPIDAQDPSGSHRTREESDHGDEDEDEDDGAYWDDIYDDYRYSRYSLASKRISTMSRASGASKASSKTRANAPPMPIPPDRPSYDAPRPSIGSDGTNGYPRPSFESGSSSRSGSTIPLARPSLTRSASDDSTHRSNMLPLTAQFPAVPMHVPVRTESRLRIVHDGYMQGGDDHGDRELQVEHGSTEGDTAEPVGLNIEVVEVTEDGDSQGQEVDVGRYLAPLNTMALSPLLHTTFGSPHSSRFTDYEDGSDQDHGRRHSNKSGQSAVSSASNGGIASALRATMEAERASSGRASAPSASPNSSSNHETGVRAIVVDDDQGNTPDINIDLVLETEAASPLPTPTSNVAQTTVATEPILTLAAEGVEKSSFLRPRAQLDQLSHPFARTSMFLPHPNAPKPVHHSQGPMYGRTTAQTYAYPPPSGNGMGNVPTHASTPPGTTFFSTHILHQLRSLSAGALQGPARRPPMTLFARCEPDLSTSMGPVPILFSLDPFPPPGPQIRVSGPKVLSQESMTPMRAATVSAPVRRGGDGMPLKEGGAVVSMGVGVGSGVAELPTLRLPKRSATAIGGAGGIQGFGTSPSSSPIPREGFVPHVGAARPRSRSFSAFGGPTLQEKSLEESVTRMQGVAPVVAPTRQGSLPPALMPRHALPPLILPSGNRDRDLDGSPISPIVQSPTTGMHGKLPPSPLAQEPITTQSPATPVFTMNGSLASPVPSSPFASSSEKLKDASPISGPPGRTSLSSSDHRSASSPQSSMPGRQGSLDVPRNNSVEGLPRRSSESSDSPLSTSLPLIPEAVSQGTRPCLSQELTLKTKLSLPALRMKASVRSKMDDAVSVASFPASNENETVQVQDMDFELVKPSLPPITGRASQDSTLTSREADNAKPDVSPILGDAASTQSHAPRSPLVPTPSSESADSIDAHRQRELKWMALFPVVPPSQARKNKKVRKLLQEGVPSSVRYLVWCHLTDSKARALPGVYAKLGQRPPVPVLEEIERDALEGFPDQPQLHTAQRPLVSLLQAYLSMVPDIQYSSGLTSIAGHLLLLAPEEDAFWIFASMMDAHLRTYFATHTLLIEIDASLFSKALELIDPALSKKLYMQLSIAPASITRPWFSTLFVGSLSADHLHRVWDIFLYDGIPYLYRVGLVVVNCIRHLLLQANTEEAALAYLAHPPPACLPSATELLVLAANVKLKDDDVRKQRAKMEQQLKKTTQARPPNGMTNVQIATISLPKA